MVWRAQIGYSFIRKWGSTGSGSGQFNRPYDIAIDMNRNSVYVTDSGNSRIQKFDTGGNFIQSIAEGQLAAPVGIAIDRANGDVYVAEASTNVIKKFTSTGIFITKWNSQPGNVQYAFYGSLAVDGFRNVYVADWGNDRIQKFDSNGNFLLKWGSTGFGSGKFRNPSGISTAQMENANVAHGNSLQKFSNSGNPLSWTYRRDPKPLGVFVRLCKKCF